MIEILSFVTGGLFRLAPEVMKIWDRKNERAHELAMFGKQMEADKARADAAVQKAEIDQRGVLGAAEMQAMAEALRAQFQPSPKTGILWLDAWNGFWDGISKSVRPVLTYWYCVFAYGAYKTALYVGLAKEGLTWDSAITEIWTEQDHAVMTSILGFWFVDRVLKYAGR